MDLLKKNNLSIRHIAVIILFSLLFATYINTFITSYTSTKMTDSISYHLNDGWCEPKSQGFGEHCFGDYYAPLKYANSESPWSGFISNYPPFSFVILKPFAYLHDYQSGRASLIAYLFFTVCCLLFPVFHMRLKHSINSLKFLALFGVSIISGPIITVIDRGNVLAIAFPFIYLYFYEVGEKNFRKAIIYATVFVLIKPQLVILSLILLALRRYREALTLYLAAGAGTLVSFAFYPSNFFENIATWFQSTINYQSIGAIGVLEPVNVSVKSSVDIIFNIFGAQFNQNLLSWSINLIAIYFIFQFFIKFSLRKFSHNVMILILFPILFMGTTYHYYLILLIVPLIIFFNEDEPKVKTKYSRRINLVYCVLFVTTLTPFALPWGLTGRFNGRGWENISATWLFAQIILTLGGIYLNQVSESKAKSMQVT